MAGWWNVTFRDTDGSSSTTETVEAETPAQAVEKVVTSYPNAPGLREFIRDNSTAEEKK